MTKSEKSKMIQWINDAEVVVNCQHCKYYFKGHCSKLINAKTHEYVKVKSSDYCSFGKENKFIF